jgi:hypothetical protein
MFGKIDKSTKPSEQTPLTGVEKPLDKSCVSSHSARSDVSGKKKLLGQSSLLSVIKHDSQLYKKAIQEEASSRENTPAGNGPTKNGFVDAKRCDESVIDSSSSQEADKDNGEMINVDKLDS